MSNLAYTTMCGMELYRNPAPYRAGHAVYYIISHGVSLAPELKPAIVFGTTAKRVRIRFENGRESAVSADSIMWRGYCEVCEEPAIEDAGRLICPRCEAPAIAEIPPDRILFDQLAHLPIYARWVRRWHQIGGEWHEAHPIHDRQSNQSWVDMLSKTGLYYSWSLNMMSECEYWHTLNTEPLHHLAIVGDEARFVAEYRRQIAEKGLPDKIAEWEHMKRGLDFFEKLIDIIQNSDLDPAELDDFDPSELSDVGRMPGRVVRLDIPTDDAEPDGEDDTTRWLDDQFGRAA